MHLNQHQSESSLASSTFAARDVPFIWRGLIDSERGLSGLVHYYVPEKAFESISFSDSASIVGFLDATLNMLKDADFKSELEAKVSLIDSDMVPRGVDSELLIKSIAELGLRKCLREGVRFLSEKYLEALSKNGPDELDQLETEYKVISECLTRNLLFRKTESETFRAFSSADLQSVSYYDDLKCFSFSSVPSVKFSNSWEFFNLYRFESAIEFWKDFYQNKPNIKLHSHDRLHSIGAKGATLETLQGVESLLSEFGNRFHRNISIPNFTTIPVSYHQEYLETGKLSEDGFKEFYERTLGANKVEYLVRSSAVFSEDGDLLGAGKYLTVGLSREAEYKDFLEAIELVYRSVDSPEAVTYRREYQVEKQELMGLVIMELIDEGVNGYVNTMRNQMPHATDVVRYNGYFMSDRDSKNSKILHGHIGPSHPFVLDRHSVLLNLPEGDGYSVQKLVEADYSKGSDLCADEPAAEAAILAEYIGQLFGHPIQMEYVEKDREIKIVQVRALPKAWVQPAQIVFPEGEAIWTGVGLGVCDQVLEVVSPYSEEVNRFGRSRIITPEEGLLILSGSYFGSENREWEKMIPKKGAVILLQVTSEMRGHVETCCLERGLTIIQNASKGSDDERFSVKRLEDYFNDSTFFDIFERAQRAKQPMPYVPNQRTFFRVISNGLEARLYANPESLKN